MTKSLLLAGNTTDGFVNYFKEYIGSSYAIFIKGGSGVGKSTFMRDVEARALLEGYEVEYVPCSSDINSHDMLKIYGLNVTMVDATSPHVFEPSCYGIDGEIFDLGAYLDRSKLIGAGGIIIDCISRKSQSYKCLYNELKIARLALDNIASIYLDNVDSEKYHELLHDILKDARNDESCHNRDAFTDYIAEDGYHDIRVEYVGDRKVIYLQSRCTDVSENILESVSKTLNDEGISHMRFHSILHPTSITAIATKNRFYTATQIDGEVVQVDNVIDNVKLATFIPDIIKERGCVSHSLKRAGKYFARSRDAHDNIEEVYRGAMDFKGLEVQKEKFIENLFNR